MLRHCSWNIRNDYPEGKKVVIRLTAVGKYRTSVLAPASVGCSHMGIAVGSISNTGKKILYTGCLPFAGFFLQWENRNVHEMVSFSGTQADIDTLLSILLTRSAYKSQKWSNV